MGSLVKKCKTVALGQEERNRLDKLKKLKRRTVKLESRDARYKQTLKNELLIAELNRLVQTDLF